MQCEEYKNHIQVYLDNELTDELKQNMRQHIKTCSFCRKEIRTYKRCLQMLQQFFRQEVPPENIRERIKQKLGCDCFNMCLPKSKQKPERFN